MTFPAGLDLDRCAGALVGLAAGDALGAGYEFSSPPKGDAEMVGGGLGRWERGEWTDDTQMALCIAEEAASGDLNPTSVAERFLDWYSSGPADVGVQTSGVLSRASSPGDVAAAAAKYFADRPGNSAGNGSLMRTAPVALAYLGDDGALVGQAMAISALTHADPLAREACAIWCVAIDRAIRQGMDALGGVREGIGLLAADRRPYWEQRVADAVLGPPSSFTPNGFVVSAFQAALAAIMHTPVPAEMPCRHLEAALQTAVHIGNDTDTVAAIAGAWLGARWGATAIPAEWSLLLHGWPGYSSRDLVRLAVLSAKRGRSDHAGWPAADSLIDHYRHHWPSKTLAKPLAEDGGLLMANVEGAVGSSADVTVSLCRMGRADFAGRTSVAVRLVDEDDPESNPNLDFVLKDLARAITSWRESGRTVLVHCVMAERRTPAVVAAYVAERFGVPGPEALKRVRAQLPATRTNPSFSDALARLWPAPRALTQIGTKDAGGPGGSSPSDEVRDPDEARDAEDLSIATALFGAQGAPGDNFRPLSLSALEPRLARVLELMVGSPSRWILIIEATKHLYVQFLAKEEGVLTAECVSNHYLPAGSKLSEEAEELLPELGWSWPSPPNQLNWKTVEFTPGASVDSAILAVHTLRRVFGCQDDDELQVKLFRSAAPDRGYSPRKRVSLRDEHKDENSRQLEAYLDDDGALRLYGSDMGPAAPPGSNGMEYNYLTKVAAAHIPVLLALLKAPAGSDILDVLEVNWAGEASDELERLLRESTIPHESSP